jgi:MFS transporter, DHA2 family, multidrug resistance protein
VLALAALLYAVGLTVLYLAVPAISEDLRPSSTQLLRITDSYGFMAAGRLVTMGTLGGRIGRRRGAAWRRRRLRSRAEVTRAARETFYGG